MYEWPSLSSHLHAKVFRTQNYAHAARKFVLSGNEWTTNNICQQTGSYISKLRLSPRDFKHPCA